MSLAIRKFVALLMLLWLPLFTGSSLAASIPMQMPPADCHEHEAATMQAIADMEMDESHHDDTSTAKHSCSACGVCHLACTGYLVVPGIALPAEPVAAREFTPYFFSLLSATYAPLLPPPLARA